MTILYSFLFCGFVCALGQVFIDKTKLTMGHLTTLYVVIGAILGFLGIYSKIVDVVGAGAVIPIINFGNSLYEASLIGYKNMGFLGILSNMFDTSCLSLSATIIFSFLFSLFSYPKE